MQRERKLFLAKGAVILSAIPVVLWAYEYGPDPGYVGVPTEHGGATCANIGCHTGTTNDPKNAGNVSVKFSGGSSYSPGVTQQVTVTISDPATTQQAWGFQLTARPSSNTAVLAGTFQSTDNLTQLMCSQPNLFVFQQIAFSAGKSQTCAAGSTLQYMEHSLAGYQSSLGHQGSYSYTFNWTPPSTNAGNIVVFVAGNAGVAGPPTKSGDHIYATKYTLTSVAFSGPPTITAGGVVSAGSFGGYTSITPGTWIEIYGNNLAPTGDARSWAGSDFNGNTAPTSLDGVTVTIGGKPAFIDYISNGQVDAQVPSDAPTGDDVPIVVTTGAGSSTAYSIRVNALQPGLLAVPQFTFGGKQYVVAQHRDGSFVLPSGSVSGATPAKAGETITIYGIGFGPVNPDFPAGQIVTAQNSLASPVTMKFGSTNATISYGGLSPGFVGLYQFNVVVPSVTANTAMPFSYTLNGSAGPQSLYTAVQ
ncbi:MAG TPA: choice-of-anchor V domain-containing protein [Candidatus Limnocylindrales bacterium]|nr:choice-of-anchor V domain-containing protein [Candidatus Limnocylindrales bacterium]